MDKKPHIDGPSLPFPQTPSASVAGRTLAESNIDVDWDSQIVALNAYLQRLGTDISKAPPEEVPVR